MGIYIAYHPQRDGVKWIEKYANRDAFGAVLKAWAAERNIPGPRGKGFAVLCTWATDNNFQGIEGKKIFVSRIDVETVRILVKQKVAAFVDRS